MQALSDAPSFYDVLSVSPNATLDEIRRAFHAAIRESHPDKDGRDGARFILQRRAWETLCDEASRREYDSMLALRAAEIADSRILEEVFLSEASGGFACRCGGVAHFDNSAPLPQTIACDGCSLRYRVIAHPDAAPVGQGAPQ